MRKPVFVAVTENELDGGSLTKARAESIMLSNMFKELMKWKKSYIR